MTRIILISGKKQSGKSSSVDYCLEQFNKNYPNLLIKQYSFADPLKRFLIDIIGLQECQCNGSDEEKNSLTNIKWGNLPFSEKKRNDLFLNSRPETKTYEIISESFMTGRELMQIFGTEIIRGMYSSVWAEAALRRIQNEKPDIAIICDSRFPDEIETFKNTNPIIVRLLRNIYNSNHRSETALDNFDWSSCSNVKLIDNSFISLEEKNALVWNSLSHYLD